MLLKQRSQLDMAWPPCRGCHWGKVGQLKGAHHLGIAVELKREPHLDMPVVLWSSCHLGMALELTRPAHLGTLMELTRRSQLGMVMELTKGPHLDMVTYLLMGRYLGDSSPLKRNLHQGKARGMLVELCKETSPGTEMRDLDGPGTDYPPVHAFVDRHLQAMTDRLHHPMDKGGLVEILWRDMKAECQDSQSLWDSCWQKLSKAPMRAP